jgi:hypothetical protein
MIQDSKLLSIKFSLDGINSSAYLRSLKHIIISILFHQFKEIKKLIDDVKKIEDEQEAADDVSVNNNTKQVLLMNKVKK